MARQDDSPAWGRRLWDFAEIPLIITVLTVATIWTVAAIISSDSGWKFGVPFRIFYTVMAIVGGGVFLLFKAGPMRPLTSTRGVFVSIALVYIVTVGVLVLVGRVFPQFDTEIAALGEDVSAVERGQALFNDQKAGCFLCHSVEGRGGTRGPDQSNLGERAATRVPGLSAEEYIRQSILEPGAFVVEPFPNIMPPGFGDRLTPQEIDDLVAYLLSLR